MSNNAMGWVNEQDKKMEEERKAGYFNIKEGDNRIQLLTHCAPLTQVFDPSTKKYRVAQEGDKNVSIKGVCWVLQDGIIKQGKLPYTVVKAIKDLMEDPDYAFESFPMPRMINIKAKGAGTKEVEYTVIPSPKEVEVSSEVLSELSNKFTPEEIVEKMKNKDVSPRNEAEPMKYPEEEINPADIPFGD